MVLTFTAILACLDPRLLVNPVGMLTKNVPLLGLVRSPARGWRVHGSAYLVGLAFYLPSLQWMRVADYRMYATWLLLSLYCAVYFTVAIAVLRRLEPALI